MSNKKSTNKKPAATIKPAATKNPMEERLSAIEARVDSKKFGETTKKLFDRIDEVEKTNLSLHETCGSVHDELSKRIETESANANEMIKSNRTYLDNVQRRAKECSGRVVDLGNHVDTELDEFRKELDRLKLQKGGGSLKEKLIVAGAWGAVAALAVYGIIRLGKLPVAEPSTIIIGKVSDELGKAVAAEIGGEIVTTGIDEAVGALLN